MIRLDTSTTDATEVPCAITTSFQSQTARMRSDAQPGQPGAAHGRSST
jgi:hypothetical protein